MIAESSSENRAFLSEFLNTMIFSSFFEMKITPQNDSQVYEIMFFDEQLDDLSNKVKYTINKKRTPFLDDKSQEVSRKYKCESLINANVVQEKSGDSKLRYPTIDIKTLQKAYLEADFEGFPVETCTV